MKLGFLKNRLREASTWRGIVGLVTLFGITLKPDQIEMMAGIGAAIYMLIETFMPDNPADEKERLSNARKTNSGNNVDPNGQLQYDSGVPGVSGTGAGRSHISRDRDDPRGAFATD